MSRVSRASRFQNSDSSSDDDGKAKKGAAGEATTSHPLGLGGDVFVARSVPNASGFDNARATRAPSVAGSDSRSGGVGSSRSATTEYVDPTPMSARTSGGGVHTGSGRLVLAGNQSPHGNSHMNSPAPSGSGSHAGALQHALQQQQQQQQQTHHQQHGPAGTAATTGAAPLVPSGSAGPAPGANAAGVYEKTAISMEFGDQYVGDAVPSAQNHRQLIPHGHGTLQSSTGRHCYIGQFANRTREGNGKLITERYVLWCRWAENRPDFTAALRVDYGNGEKYLGYLAAVTDSAMFQAVRTSNTPMSKFSQWVQSTVLLREKWGEMVFHNGARYFGQWESDQPSGFGCMIHENGDRYVGNWWKGKYHAAGTLFASNKPGDARHFLGTIYDGHWTNGVFDSEEGHVTFPCRTRVSGEWKNKTQVQRASVHNQPRHEASKRWVQTYHWEGLFCGSSDTSRKRDVLAAQPHRNALLQARSKQDVERAIAKLVAENPSIANSLKIFKRCFYFLYGTCGTSGEIGAGLGNNKLGWCYVRNLPGGCIHRGRGRRIESADIDAALGDVISYVTSMRRWVEELIGDGGVALVAEHDCDVFVGRHLLDMALQETHGPLFNLYMQVYRCEQIGLTAGFHRLADVTLDDLGVNFGRHGAEEKLFAPYADAVHSLQQISKSYSLSAKVGCLKRWSNDIDVATRMSQMRLQEEELARLSSFVRENGAPNDFTNWSFAADKAGAAGSTAGGSSNNFAASGPSSSMALMKGSIATAAPTPTGALQSPRGAASGMPFPRAAPAVLLNGAPTTANSTSGGGGGGGSSSATAPSGGASGTASASFAAASGSAGDERVGSSSQYFARALAVESGSADDLLPIHQYVLIRAHVPQLYAHTQLLLDLSAEETFVDGTSQDAFCITTLQACITMLPQLFLDLRDATGAIAPMALFEKRLEDALVFEQPAAALRVVRRWVPLLLDALGGDGPFAAAQRPPPRTATVVACPHCAAVGGIDAIVAAARIAAAKGRRAKASDEWSPCVRHAVAGRGAVEVFPVSTFVDFGAWEVGGRRHASLLSEPGFWEHLADAARVLRAADIELYEAVTPAAVVAAADAATSFGDGTATPRGGAAAAAVAADAADGDASGLVLVPVHTPARGAGLLSPRGGASPPLRDGSGDPLDSPCLRRATSAGSGADAAAGQQRRIEWLFVSVPSHSPTVYGVLSQLLLTTSL